jgi:hypothetical protein
MELSGQFSAKKKGAPGGGEVTTDEFTGGVLRGGKPAEYGPLQPTEASPRVGIVRGVNRGFLETDAPTQQPGWSLAASRTAMNRAPGAGRDLTGVMRDVGAPKSREMTLPSQSGDVSGLGDEAGEFKLNQKPKSIAEDTSKLVTAGGEKSKRKVKEKADPGDDVKQSTGYTPRPDVITEQAARQATKRPAAQAGRNSGSSGNPQLGLGETYGPVVPRIGDVTDIRRVKGDPVTTKTDSGSTVTSVPVSAKRFTGESWEDIQTTADAALSTQRYSRVNKDHTPLLPAGYRPGSIRPESGESTDYDHRSGIGTGAGSVSKVNRSQAATAASAEELEQARQDRGSNTRGIEMLRENAQNIAATGKIELNRGGEFSEFVDVPAGNAAAVAALQYLKGQRSAANTVKETVRGVNVQGARINNSKGGQAPTGSRSSQVSDELNEAVTDEVVGMMSGPPKSVPGAGQIEGVPEVRNVEVTRDTRPGTPGDVGRLKDSKANKPRLGRNSAVSYEGMDDDGVVVNRDTGGLMKWNEDLQENTPLVPGPSIYDLRTGSTARNTEMANKRTRVADWEASGAFDPQRIAMGDAIDAQKRYGRGYKAMDPDAASFDDDMAESLARQKADRQSLETAFNPIAVSGDNRPSPEARPIETDVAASRAQRRRGRDAERAQREEAASNRQTSINDAINDLVRRQSAGEDFDFQSEVEKIRKELGG